jgi:hypothetical protein
VKTEDIGAARERLVEHARMLGHLAEDKLEHLPMPGVGHRGHARSPAIHEVLLGTRVASTIVFTSVPLAAVAWLSSIPTSGIVPPS